MGTELQKTVHQELQLRERSTALIATLTNSEEADRFARTLSIEKIVAVAVPIVVMKQVVPMTEIKRALDAELTRFVASLNLKWNLNDGQIKGIVEDLLIKYPNESLEDFILVFRKAKLGEFKNEDGNATIYRLDSAVIFDWMNKYLDMKYEEHVRQLDKQKDQYHNQYKKSEKDYLQIWMESIKHLEEQEAKEGGKKLSTPKTDILRNNLNRMTPEQVFEEGQVKPVYKPHPESTPEYKKMIDLKIQYGREHTEPTTGKVKPGSPTFDDWLKTQGV